MGNSSNSPWGGDKTLTRAAADEEEVMTAVWSRAICNNGAGRGRNCDLFGGRDQISEATRVSLESAYVLGGDSRCAYYITDPLLIFHGSLLNRHLIFTILAIY